MKIKLKAVLPFLLLLAMLSAYPVYADDAASVEAAIPFKADKGAVVTLKDSNEEITAEAGSEEFVLSYAEPGKYSYVISCGDRSYDVDVYVAYDDLDVLYAAVIIYEPGKTEKLTEADFRTPVPPTEETETSSEAEQESSGTNPGGSKDRPETGDKSMLISWAALAGSMFIFLGIFITLYLHRRRKEDAE